MTRRSEAHSMLTSPSEPQVSDAGAVVSAPGFERLRGNTFIRNAWILSSGAAIGHAFTLAAAPLLTRMYGPADFGGLGLFTSFLTIMSVAVALRYEVSIVSGRDEAEAAYLTFASFLFALPISILAGGILWLLNHFSAIGYGDLAWYAPLLLASAMFFVGVFTALRYWCLREERFGQVSKGVVVQSAGRAIFQSVFGAAGFHSVGLLLGETLGRCLGMSRMFRNAWPILRCYLVNFRRTEFIGALWRHRKFPLYSLPSSFLDALYMSLAVPLIIRLYGASVGGYYSLVSTAVTVPSVVVTVAIADTFHSRLAACARETPAQVMGLFRRTSLGLLLLGSIPAAVLWFWSEPLFRLVFGARWALSGTIAAIVAPWYLAEFVVTPVSRVVLVLSGQEMKLIWDLLSLGSLLTVFFVAQWRMMAPLQTIRVLTLVNTILRVVYYLILIRIITRFRRRHSVQPETACLP
jgi:O-antigen/teichoic acid export membrane protein